MVSSRMARVASITPVPTSHWRDLVDQKVMPTGLLFDIINPAPAVADTSRECFDRILPTLQQREIEVFLKLWAYLDATGHNNATGGELSEHFDVPVTSLRPRLTGLVAKGWVEKCPIRNSRADGELRCHPVRPCVPRAAVDRARLQKGSL